MEFLKKYTSEVMLGALGVIMVTTLDWDWTNVKSFISGGVIAICLIRLAKSVDR